MVLRKRRTLALIGLEWTTAWLTVSPASAFGCWKTVARPQNVFHEQQLRLRDGINPVRPILSPLFYRNEAGETERILKEDSSNNGRSAAISIDLANVVTPFNDVAPAVEPVPASRSRGLDDIDAINLPRSSMLQKRQKLVRNKKEPAGDVVFLPSVELLLGRIAMVSAVLLFGTEFLTGKSFPEQLFHFFGNLPL